MAGFLIFMAATAPTSPFIPEIPDNSRFKGSFAFIDASLCKRDNKKEALQMKSFFFLVETFNLYSFLI